MHPQLAEAIVEKCRARERDGDCPSVSQPGGEMMEFCILELARQRDAARTAALRTLAEAFKKFAPDLAHELALRWESANAEREVALADLLATLGAPSLPQPSNG